MDAGLRRAVDEYKEDYNPVFWRPVTRIFEEGEMDVQLWKFEEIVSYENKTYWCVVIQKTGWEPGDPNPSYVEDVYAEAWEF